MMKWVDKKVMCLNLLLRDSKLFSFKGLLSEKFQAPVQSNQNTNHSQYQSSKQVTINKYMILSLRVGIDPLWNIPNSLMGNISKYSDLSPGGYRRKCLRLELPRHSVLFLLSVAKTGNQYELFHNIWVCKYIFLNKIKSDTNSSWSLEFPMHQLSVFIFFLFLFPFFLFF